MPSKLSDDADFMGRLHEGLEAVRQLQPTAPLDRDQVVALYRIELGRIGADYLAGFDRNLRNQPEAAHTEALAWQVVRQWGGTLARYEHPATGGQTSWPQSTGSR